MTITLPQRRLDRLAQLLEAIPPTRKRLALAPYHQLLGELRSMALALPGARGLFSHLQAALNTASATRLRLSPSFHAALNDFRWLHADVGARPTRLQELVPTTPTLTGTHDAAATGAGGVWLPHPSAVARSTRLHIILEPNGHFHRKIPPLLGPVVWRMAFPLPIQRRLVSANNPTGSINNSQLELAGAVLHDEVAAECFDVRERTIKSSTDNLNTLYWDRRGSVTTTSPTATLLRQHSLHQRFHRYVKLRDYIPGPLNRMADDASRLCHLTPTQFLSHFNQVYPQSLPWRLYTITPTMRSSVICALQHTTSPRESFLRAPAKPLRTGTPGPFFVKNYRLILPFSKSKTPSPSSRSLLGASATGSSTLPADKYAVKQWIMPYAALGKRLRQWGPRTHATPRPGNLILGYNEC